MFEIQLKDGSMVFARVAEARDGGDLVVRGGAVRATQGQLFRWPVEHALIRSSLIQIIAKIEDNCNDPVIRQVEAKMAGIELGVSNESH